MLVQSSIGRRDRSFDEWVNFIRSKIKFRQCGRVAGIRDGQRSPTLNVSLLGIRHKQNRDAFNHSVTMPLIAHQVGRFIVQVSLVAWTHQ